MSNSINLIEKHSEKSDKEVLAGKIRRVSFIMLISVGLISIVFFLLSYRFSVGYVKGQEDKLLKKMSEFEQLGSKVFLLNTRLTDISSLLSSRSKFNQLSDAIVNVKPDGLNISKYQIDATGVSIQANSNNLSDVDSFLNALLQLTKEKKLTIVQINNLTANLSGYSIQLTLN